MLLTQGLSKKVACCRRTHASSQCPLGSAKRAKRRTGTWLGRCTHGEFVCHCAVFAIVLGRMQRRLGIKSRLVALICWNLAPRPSPCSYSFRGVVLGLRHLTLVVCINVSRFQQGDFGCQCGQPAAGVAPFPLPRQFPPACSCADLHLLADFRHGHRG